MNDLISVNLTTYLGVDLIHRKNAAETISLLAILPSIDLIICNSKTDEEDSANLLNDYLIDNQLDISMIVLGGNVIKQSENVINIPNT